ncbi:MAG TPA: MBL fold metallo-hydrolase [Bacteroidales bacterium]|nr:MBL fold metallo-hydrolase [Bacteroidales bacterium]HRC90008.1 MBL fold metallo-hydrolase [Bacteroidales bacterium]
MKITFLGTGTSQGVPVIACDCRVCMSDDPKDKRLRSSLLLEEKNIIVVFDAGPDFRQQMLREKVTRLDAIILSHEHRDHIAGMDDVRAFNYKMQDAIDIYAEKRVLETIKREYSYVFAENKYPGIPEMRLNEISLESFSVKGLEILPVRAFHMELPILGFRVGDFAYITDANRIPEESKEKLYGVKYLVVNALRKEKQISHFNLSEAIDFIKEISPLQAYLTHISHQMGLYSELSKELPDGITLAYDGLTVIFDQ